MTSPYLLLPIRTEADVLSTRKRRASIEARIRVYNGHAGIPWDGAAAFRAGFPISAAQRFVDPFEADRWREEWLSERTRSLEARCDFVL